MSTDRFARTAHLAILVSAVVIVLCIVTSIVLAILGRPGEQVTSVDVQDDAGIVDTVLIEEDIGALRTHEPVRVVVWVREGVVEDNINELTLNWARDREEDALLSPNGRYWADGLLFITLSVEQNDRIGSGQVGTYFGEDVKIEPISAQQELQSRGYDDFRNRNWESGIIAIAGAAAGDMARPAWTGFALTFGLPIALILIALVNIVGTRIMNRQFQAINSSFTTTTHDVHATVSDTEFILDHGFGEKVKNTAASVLRQYDRTLDTRNAVAATPLWKLSAANVSLWKNIHGIKTATEDIDDSAGLVRRATALYMGSGDWEQVWANEVEETAAHLRDARDNQEIVRHAGPTGAKDLRDFCTHALDQLEDIRARGVAGGGENISQRLDEIAQLRAELTRRMSMLDRTTAPTNSGLARHVDKAISEERWRRNDHSRSITGFYDRTSFYSPRAFVVGHAVGAQRHKAAQQRMNAVSSSSGSSSSYGSSGGGFRGSGSSSRF